VTVVDPVAAKAELAVACGAAELVTPAEAEAEASGTFDVVIEAAGVTGTARLATTLARRGATVVLCGLPPATDTVATLAVVSKGLAVRSVFGASRTAWSDAVAAFARGDVSPGLLVTHELGLDEAEHALTLVAGRRPDIGKVLLKP
jgi:threonine dehydrogenase-like Zn-dependent dehydrogenase